MLHQSVEKSSRKVDSTHQTDLDGYWTVAENHLTALGLVSVDCWTELGGISMRVLVVEDDRSLGAFLKTGMELEGHRVEWVEDGEAALAHAAANHPELVLLDLCLPKMDGMEVLAEMRARHDDASVLVLTGRSDPHVQVQCLDMGADDCLLKPFSFHELTARCRALRRRREQFADSVLRHGDLELRRIEHTVARAGRTIELTAKEFALLEFLMLHRGECVSRGQLLTETWQMPAESCTNVVDVYINYLRRKLAGGKAHDAQAEVIETVRGMGYRLGGLNRNPVARPTGQSCPVHRPAYA
jgi:DNA-binding response OmpR family regulator